MSVQFRHRHIATVLLPVPAVVYMAVCLVAGAGVGRAGSRLFAVALLLGVFGRWIYEDRRLARSGLVLLMIFALWATGASRLLLHILDTLGAVVTAVSAAGIVVAFMGLVHGPLLASEGCHEGGGDANPRGGTIHAPPGSTTFRILLTILPKRSWDVLDSAYSDWLHDWVEAEAARTPSLHRQIQMLRVRIGTVVGLILVASTELGFNPIPALKRLFK